MGKHSAGHKSLKLLEVLREAPVALEHASLMRFLSGPLYPIVARIFPQEYSTIYILSEQKRRQVWNAVIAAMIGKDFDERTSREDLLKLRGERLLSDAYGSAPQGFITLLGYCGDGAKNPAFYKFWHEFLSKNAGSVREIIGSHMSLDDLHEILRALPEPLQTIRVASTFRDRRGALSFVEAVRWMNSGNPDTPSWENIRGKLEAGCSPRKLLDSMFNRVACMPPFFVDQRFRHVSTVGEMKTLARRFENCLGMEFTVDEALKGETQFYQWVGEGEPCIVSIANDLPFGWMLGSIKGVGNADAEPATYGKIVAALKKHRIFARPSVTDLIAGVRYARRSRDDDRNIAGLTWEEE